MTSSTMPPTSVTFSPKNGPPKSREFWQNRPYGGGFCREENEVHGRTDCLCLEAGRDRHSGCGSYPEDGYFGSNLLQLEKEVWRLGYIGTAEAQTALRGEPAPETDGRRSEPRQTDASGCAVKKIIRPARKRALVNHLKESYRVSERRACVVLRFGRSTYRYQGRRDEQAALRMRIREIAAVRVRYGYKRICVLLRREGWQINHKRVYRLYCEEGLNLRAKKKRKRPGAALCIPRQQACCLNDTWSMDFAADSLFNGRRFRVLTVVDNFSR